MGEFAISWFGRKTVPSYGVNIAWGSVLSNPEPKLETFKEPRDRFQGTDSASLYGRLAGRYDNPICRTGLPATQACSEIDSWAP